MLSSLCQAEKLSHKECCASKAVGVLTSWKWTNLNELNRVLPLSNYTAVEITTRKITITHFPQVVQPYHIPVSEISCIHRIY